MAATTPSRQRTRLKLTPAHFKEFTGTLAEAEAFVISANLHRRQLNNKQKQESLRR